MVTTSNVLLELPKRTPILVEDRAYGGVRLKARGLFWLALATVVLSFVVVLASLWKTFETPSVRVPSSPVAVTNPAPASPAICDVPSPPAPADEPIVLADDPAPDPELEPPGPPGFPSLNQFP